MDWLDGLLGGSPIVTGGATLALFGLLAVWLRDVPAKVFGWAKHFFVSTLTVDSRDELMFPALVEYMDSREALRRLNNFTARAVRQGTSYQSLHDELQQGGRPLTVLSPGEGFHIFYLDGRRLKPETFVTVVGALGAPAVKVAEFFVVPDRGVVDNHPFKVEVRDYHHAYRPHERAAIVLERTDKS